MIILQPGQIWLPHLSTIPGRIIDDLHHDDVLCRTLSPTTKMPEGPTFTCKRSLFRRWIKAQAAVLEFDTTKEIKVSPSAELAKRIVSLRKGTSMSQQVLAEKLGVSRSAVAFWETGRVGSVRKHIPRLAQILNVPVEIFLTGMIEKQAVAKLTTDESDLIDLYRRLGPGRKLAAQRWIERQTRLAHSDPQETA